MIVRISRPAISQYPSGHQRVLRDHSELRPPQPPLHWHQSGGGEWRFVISCCWSAAFLHHCHDSVNSLTCHHERGRHSPPGDDPHPQAGDHHQHSQDAAKDGQYAGELCQGSFCGAGLATVRGVQGNPGWCPGLLGRSWIHGYSLPPGGTDPEILLQTEDGKG